MQINDHIKELIHKEEAFVKDWDTLCAMIGDGAHRWVWQPNGFTCMCCFTKITKAKAEEDIQREKDWFYLRELCHGELLQEHSDEQEAALGRFIARRRQAIQRKIQLSRDSIAGLEAKLEKIDVALSEQAEQAISKRLANPSKWNET